MPAGAASDWKPQRLTWVALLMAWDEGQTLNARFEHARDVAREMHRHWTLGTSYSGFTQALLRHTSAALPALKTRLRRIMQERAGEFWRIRGWCAFGVDGTRIEAPHTQDNETGLGCAGRERTGPQVELTTLWHLRLALPWDFRVGPGIDSERAQARAMFDDLPKDALVVADAGFAGYEFCRDLLERGVSFLLRVGGNLTLLTGLGYHHEERDGLAYLWPNKLRNQEPLVLRLIVLATGAQPLHLLTDVLDKEALPDETAGELYRLRWGEEVYHRGFKQTLQRRRLLSRTTATCLAEASWTILGMWLLGLLTVVPNLMRQREPSQWSVAKSRDAVRCAIRNTRPSAQGTTRESLTRALQAAVHDQYKRKGSKTARNYPRKKKQKPPGPPKIKPATTRQIKSAKALPPRKIPLKWTA